MFPQEPTSDISEKLDILTKLPEYKVGRIKIGGGGKEEHCDNPEKSSQAAHFLLSHHVFSSLLAAHNRNGMLLNVSLDLKYYICLDDGFLLNSMTRQKSFLS